MLQVLAEHFATECQALNRLGILVADWSGHQHDQHASQCVASFVASYALPMHPAVYYGSSHSVEAIQVADLLVGIRRRVVEGDQNLEALDDRLATIRATRVQRRTCKNRSHSNRVSLF